MKTPKLLSFFSLCRAALLLAALAALGCGKLGGTEFSAFFRDAKMLKRGDPVTQNGIALGKVTAIEPNPDGRIEVRMRLDKKNAAATRAGSLAFITGNGAQRVELYPLAAGGPAIAAGDRLEGIDSRIRLEARLLSTKVGPALTTIKNKLVQAVSSINDYMNSPEGRKLAGDTKQFLIDAKDKIGQEVQDFRAAHPDFEEKLKKQLAEARRQGNEALIKVLKQIEDSLAKSDQP